MSTEANKEVVLRYYEEVLNKGDLDALDELAVADYEEHNPLPGQGAGRDGVRDRVSMLVRGFAPRFTIEDVIAEGDEVVVRWTNTGVHGGEFMGIPPTERTVSIAGIDIHRLQDGKMAEHWDVVDLLSMLVQLGVVTLPGAPAE
jgi:steroid delta-isomerase-like uncharacterized protein